MPNKTELREENERLWRSFIQADIDRVRWWYELLEARRPCPRCFKEPAD